MVGEKIYDAYAPDRYYNHDAEDPEGITELERTSSQRGGGDQPPRRRVGPRHLREHQPGADGRRPQVGGHRPDQLRVAARAPQPADHPRLAPPTWSRARASCTARSIASAGSSTRRIKVFHIETTINNRMFEEPVGFLMKKEEDFTEFDRLKLQGMKYALSKMPRPDEAEDVLQHLRALRGDRASSPARPSRPTRRRSR